MTTPRFTRFLTLAREYTALLIELCAEPDMLSRAQLLHYMEHHAAPAARIVALDRALLDQWVAAMGPPPVVVPDVGLRAGNIARTRRSKAGMATHDTQPVLLRWFEPDASALSVALTRRMGLIGLTTSHGDVLQPRALWVLLTVENWEPFVAARYELCGMVVVVAYTGGNIADAMFRALARIQPPLPQFP